MTSSDEVSSIETDTLHGRDGQSPGLTRLRDRRLFACGEFGSAENGVGVGLRLGHVVLRVVLADGPMAALSCYRGRYMSHSVVGALRGRLYRVAVLAAIAAPLATGGCDDSTTPTTPAHVSTFHVPPRVGVPMSEALQYRSRPGVESVLWPDLDALRCVFPED